MPPGELRPNAAHANHTAKREPATTAKHIRPTPYHATTMVTPGPLTQLQLAQREARHLTTQADELYTQADQLLRTAMHQAWQTHSLATIAHTLGISRQQAHRILHHQRRAVSTRG